MTSDTVNFDVSTDLIYGLSNHKVDVIRSVLVGLLVFSQTYGI